MKPWDTLAIVVFLAAAIVWAWVVASGADVPVSPVRERVWGTSAPYRAPYHPPTATHAPYGYITILGTPDGPFGLPCEPWGELGAKGCQPVCYAVGCPQ